MAKNFRQNIRTYQSLQTATKARTRKGKLKGRNKKETKILRLTCPHHYLNKRGILKSATFAPNNDVLICEQCKNKIRADQVDKNELKSAVKFMKDCIRQLQYANIEINGGEKTQQDLNKGMVFVDRFPKLYSNTFDVVVACYGKKNKKNKNKNNGKYNNPMGEWVINKRR